MKNLLLVVGYCILLLGCDHQEKDTDENSEHHTNEVTTSEGYDSLLAAELEADVYGMSKYVFAFLRKGPNRDQDSTEAAAIQRGHLDNMIKWADEGKLVLGGPFMDDGDFQGIYVFNSNSIEEVEQWIEDDPAIKAGRLIMELHPWYGSATVKMIYDWHKKVQQEGI